MAASVLGYYDCKKKLGKRRREMTYGLAYDVSKTMIGPLCELQLITSMAVLIAGLAQWPEITYYHANFVLLYWWLALNSFWAIRQEVFLRKPSIDSWRLKLRKYAIFVSVMLFLVMDSMVLLREKRHWDDSYSGHCYLTTDASSYESGWFWHAGVTLYAIVLFLSFIPRINDSLETRMRNLVDRCQRLGNRWAEKRTLVTDSSWSLGCGYRFGELLLLGIVTVIFWCSIQFLALWSVGQAFYALEVLFYWGMFAWCFYDIVDLKVENAHLLKGSEISWTFGQVLAVAMMLSLIFTFLDVVKGMCFWLY